MIWQYGFITAVILVPSILFSDPVTPSQLRSGESMPEVPENVRVTFENAIAGLTETYPVRIDKFSQVTQNSFNWAGPEDASLVCEIGFTPQAIVVRGRVLDNQPLIQPLERPAMPDWWRVGYGADGIEVLLEDATNSARKVHLVFNLSSAGVQPRVEVLQSLILRQPASLAGADFQILELPSSAAPQLGQHSNTSSGFEFRCAIPTEQLAEPKFFSSPMTITFRLHDLDGDYRSYLKMEEVINRR